MSQTRIIEQWWWERGDHELDRTLGEWYQALKFGPIPGAYLNFQFSIPGKVNDASVSNQVMLPPVPAGTGTFEMRPIFFGVFASTPPGQPIAVNVLIPNDPPGPFRVLLLDPNALVEGSNPFSTNRRVDFNVDKIIVPPGTDFPFLIMRVEEDFAGGEASDVEGHLICKEISQVEP